MNILNILFWGLKRILGRVVKGPFFSKGRLISFGVVGLFILHVGTVSVLSLTPQQRDVFRSCVCSISVKASLAAQGQAGAWSGTGFVCDKNRAIICTNRHVVGYGVVATYEIEFSTGHKAMAQLLYVDPRHDFAFLQLVDPTQLPPQTHELSRFAEPCLNDVVFMAGNNQGRSFSFQEGRVSDLYQPSGFMLQPSFGCMINAVGGSSGSPLVNKSLDVVGLNFAGFGDGRCLAIRSTCLASALKSLKDQTVPARRCIGALLELAPLDDQIQILNFPHDVARQYVHANPHARSRVLQVQGVLRGTPAEGVLRVGDVVVSVDGKTVGSCLATYESYLNTTPAKRVTLGIYRAGTFQTLDCPLYDLQPTVVTKILVFDGGTFVQADEQLRWQFNLPTQSVVLVNALAGSPFAGILGTEPDQMILTPFKTLDQLATQILIWQKKKTFAFPGRFLCPFQAGFAGILFHNRLTQIFSITHAPAQSYAPHLFVKTPQGWSTEPVTSPPSSPPSNPKK